MIISFKNFGPILDFSIDLSSDFTLIVGDNNIGKSYAISLTYAILKNLRNNENTPRYFYGNNQGSAQNSPLEMDFINNFKKKKTIKVTDIINKYSMEYLKNYFLNNLENSIISTFGDISNLQNRKNGESADILIKFKNISLTLRITGDHLCIHEYSDGTEFIFKKSKKYGYDIPLDDTRDEIFYIYGNELEPEYALNSIITIGVSNFVDCFAKDIGEAHYLPASRSGLYQALSAFSQIIAELSKSRSFLTKRIELPAISEPLSDYFIKLTDIKQKTVNDPNNKILIIADELERSILEGSIEFDSKSKRLMYSPFGTKNLKLDLSSTSSMVSEVAPIVAYMRHVLAERDHRSKRIWPGTRPSGKQIIFIEEPEAHLHPRNQALLMESFARIVSECNVKIIMTSHSNFIFNKISNLIIGKKFGTAKIIGYIFKKSTLGTIGTNLEIDHFGISDENFTEVSEQIFEEKMNLIENLGD